MATVESTTSKISLKSLPRNVWVTTLTSFLTDISSEMIFTLLPLFLANVLGTSTAVIGLIDGIAETTSSILKGFSGWFSDKLGKRKWLAVFGYGLSAFIKPFLYFAGTWYAILAIRFLDRTGKGIRTSPRDALIADSVDTKSRGTAFGLHRAGDTAGAMVGLSIALIVVLLTQSQSLNLNQETFQLLILIGIVPCFLAVLILAIGAKDAESPPKDEAETESKPEITQLGFFHLRRRFRFFLLIMAIFTLGNSSDSFLILLAQKNGLSVVGIIGMLISFNFIYAVFSGPLGVLSDKIGRYRLIVIGWLIYVVLYLCFALANSAWQIWLLYAAYGLYYAAFEGTAKAFVADMIPAEQRGTAYGYYNATTGLMALPASLIAGILWQGVGNWSGFGSSAPFFFGAFLAGLALILLLFMEQNL